MTVFLQHNLYYVVKNFDILAQSYCSLERREIIQLNKSTDYAIRILLHLAMQEKARSTGEISKAIKIPERETSYLLKELTGNQILKSTRGKFGGYSLARSLENITMYDVISWTTKDMHINACLKDVRECSRNHTEACKVRKCFCELQDLVETRLQSITLDQFV